MTGKTRVAIYTAAVAAVMALGIDWDPDEPARRKAIRRHPAGRKTARKPARRTVRLDFDEAEVFARFAAIVEANRPAQSIPRQRTSNEENHQ